MLKEIISLSLDKLSQPSSQALTRESIWVSALGCAQKPRYQLFDVTWLPSHPEIQLIETLEHLQSGRLYFRIYLKPRDTYVPTIIIGDRVDLVPIARRDQQPLHQIDVGINSAVSIAPSNQEHALCLSSKDISQIAGLWLNTWDHPSYLVRPCSFVMSWIDICLLDGRYLLLKAYVNQLVQNDYFVHINSHPETEDISPKDDIHAYIVSNSSEYVKRQQRLNWQQLQ